MDGWIDGWMGGWMDGFNFSFHLTGLADSNQYEMDMAMPTTTHIWLTGSGAGNNSGTVSLPYNPTRCLLYTSPSPRDMTISRMPSSA